MDDLISFNTPEEEYSRLLTSSFAEQQRSHGDRLRALLLGTASLPPGRIWWWGLDGGRSGNDEACYERAAAQAAEMRERLEWDWDGSLRRGNPRLEELAVVAADVPRTCPELQRSGSLDGLALQRLLDAIVVSAADGAGGGYTQGMSDVAAFLLDHGRLKQWEAYACMRALSQRPLFHALSTLDQDCWAAFSQAYTAHLRQHEPDVASHLAAVGLEPFFYLPEWLVSLWCRSLEADAARVAWGLLLLEGDLAITLRASLGVTTAIGPNILNCRDLTTCREICRDAPRRLSSAAFRECTLAGPALDTRLLRPLAKWLDTATPAAPAIEL